MNSQGTCFSFCH